MARITSISQKKSDGSFSDPIAIGAKASNVVLEDGKTIETKISELDTKITEEIPPLDHASTNTLYGVGTDTKYGHVKVKVENGLGINNGEVSLKNASLTEKGATQLSSEIASKSETVAATPKAVSDIKDDLQKQIDELNNVDNYTQYVNLVISDNSGFEGYCRNSEIQGQTIMNETTGELESVSGDLELVSQNADGSEMQEQSFFKVNLRRISDEIYDYIDLDSGLMVQRIQVVVFNGSENWQKVGVEGFSSYTITNVLNVKTDAKMISDIYKQIPHANRYEDKSMFVYKTSDINNGLNITDNDYATLQEFKDYLEARPLTVLYELDQPIVVELATEQIRTYLNQTNISISGTKVLPIISTQVPKNINTAQQNSIVELDRKSEFNTSEIMEIVVENVDGIEKNKQDIAALNDELEIVSVTATSANNSVSTKAPISHSSSETTYGIGTDTNYGHTKLSDATNSTSAASSGVAATPYAVKTAYDKGDEALIAANTKAPTNHASAATTYGVGTDTNYGHVKLSDSVVSTSTSSDGIAASPAAVKTAYDRGTTGINNAATALNTANAKAPTSHASTATTYGMATASNYGHIRLSDSITSGSSTTGGYAATPAAVNAVNAAKIAKSQISRSGTTLYINL